MYRHKQNPVSQSFNPVVEIYSVENWHDSNARIHTHTQSGVEPYVPSQNGSSERTSEKEKWIFHKFFALSRLCFHLFCLQYISWVNKCKFHFALFGWTFLCVCVCVRVRSIHRLNPQRENGLYRKIVIRSLNWFIQTFPYVFFSSSLSIRHNFDDFVRHILFNI